MGTKVVIDFLESFTSVHICKSFTLVVLAEVSNQISELVSTCLLLLESILYELLILLDLL